MKQMIICVLAAVLFTGKPVLSQDADMAAVRSLLDTFQQGYTERDVEKAESWCTAIFHEDVEIIGTYAVKSGGPEWMKGRKKAIPVFQNDWKNWGDLRADLEHAQIGMHGDMAWVSFEATITKSPANTQRGRTLDQSAGSMLNRIGELSRETDGKENRARLLEAAYLATLVLYQYDSGDEFIWPLRISGALQKINGKWKFRQLHISHPNRGFPNVRY